MSERNPYTDITAGHHGSNKQSNASNIKVAPFKANMREKILGLMALRDAQGLGTTCRQAADYFQRESGHLSPRFTEMKADGVIEETGVIENGFMSYRLPGSKNVSLKLEVLGRKLLNVVGPGLAGEAVFEKTTAGWHIVKITDCIRTIIAEVALSEMENTLKARGCSWHWTKLPVETPESE